MAMASSLPAFTVRRGHPTLVGPAEPTPEEIKTLSPLDDQIGMRFYSSGIHLYRNDPSKAGVDPAAVIREAIAKTLVFYYPIAGRLREEADGALVIDCNGKGLLFVEADADITADEFGDVQSPPFPGFENFIYESNEYVGIEPVIDMPLAYIQVTRLRCGGFVFGQRFCHCAADAAGAMQFERAVGEIARGAAVPSVLPVWAREIFFARDPPRVSYAHLAYQDPVGGHDRLLTTTRDEVVQLPFVFGPKEIAGLRKHAPPQLRSSCSRFDLISACIWRSRTAALGYAPDDEVRFSFVVNARGRPGIPVPKGYYGNAVVYMVAASTAEALCDRPIGYALELIRNTKHDLTYDFMLSVADLLVLRGRPLFAVVRTYIVSDISHVGFKDIDFGWGEAVYGGPAKSGEGHILGGMNYFGRFRKENGEEAVVVPVCLPKDAMERFQEEVAALTKEPLVDPYGGDIIVAA